MSTASSTKAKTTSTTQTTSSDHKSLQGIKQTFEQVVSDQGWWTTYYNRTGDYSVGPAITEFADVERNRSAWLKTIQLYQKANHV